MLLPLIALGSIAATIAVLGAATGGVVERQIEAMNGDAAASAMAMIHAAAVRYAHANTGFTGVISDGANGTADTTRDCWTPGVTTPQQCQFSAELDPYLPPTFGTMLPFVSVSDTVTVQYTEFGAPHDYTATVVVTFVDPDFMYNTDGESTSERRANRILKKGPLLIALKERSEGASNVGVVRSEGATRVLPGTLQMRDTDNDGTLALASLNAALPLPSAGATAVPVDAVAMVSVVGVVRNP